MFPRRGDGGRRFDLFDVVGLEFVNFDLASAKISVELGGSAPKLRWRHEVGFLACALHAFSASPPALCAAASCSCHHTRASNNAVT